MQIDEVVGWLGQVWDEDEALALAAQKLTSDHWRTSQAVYEWTTAGTGEKSTSLGSLTVWNGVGQSVMSTCSDHDAAVGLHIAQHQPSAALARIAADRQILELHMGDHDCGEIHTGNYAADWPEAASWGVAGGEWRHVMSEHFEEDEACPTLRLLASAYADRPGYQEDWRPAQLP